jgi:predicted nucleotidyltransferase
MPFMTRADALAVLKAHEPELRAAGVLSVSVFGSVARGEQGTDSDVDVAVRLADDFADGGLDYFYRLEQLGLRLARLLGQTVDVVAEPARTERFQREIDRDRALAF